MGKARSVGELRLNRTLATVLLGISFLIGCRVTDLPIWHPLHRETSQVHPIEEILDIAYQPGPWALSHRNKLDVYIPKGVKNFPVVVLVHGGAWMMGDNRCCGLYSSVGKFLAGQGIGVVMPNYRLSPWVRHPEHLRDVAKAVAWTKMHITEVGGNAENLFLAGHSAGGHLVALLATEEKTLAEEGVNLSDLRGVIAVSGVYRIPTEKLSIALGGNIGPTLRLQQFFPLREPLAKSTPTGSLTQGLRTSFDLFLPVFGDDEKNRRNASPLFLTRPGLPAFLIVTAEDDLPLLPEMAKELHECLDQHGVSSTLLNVPRRNHHSIIFHAVESNDPVAQAMMAFVRTKSLPISNSIR